MTKPNVYIAGPLHSSGRMTDNMRAVLRVAEWVREAGGIPFVPHLFAFWDMIFPHDAHFWMEMDLAWFDHCDGLIMLPGTSPHLDAEWKYAEGLERCLLDDDDDDANAEVHRFVGALIARRVAHVGAAGGTLDALRVLQERCYGNAKSHGFHDGDNCVYVDAGTDRGPRVTTVLSKLALIGEEVGEAVSSVRKKPINMENLVEELADIVIRSLDLAGALELDLGAAIIAKMAKNASRPHMHGKSA